MTIIPLDEQAKAEISDFANRLYRSQEGFVYAPTFDRDNEVWTKHFYQWPNERDRLVNDIVSRSANVEVYIAPCMFKLPGDASRNNVLGSHVVYTETDGPYNPKGAPTKPSFYVLSSSENNHIHFYWEMETFSTDVTLIESINRAIAYSMQADYSAWDANQVLRPPLTVNHKRSQPTSRLFKNPEARHNFWNTFADLKVPETVAVDIRDYKIEDLPNPQRVISKYAIPEDFYSLLTAAVEEGHRSEALMKIGYFGAELQMTDTEIYSILVWKAREWGKFKNHQNPISAMRNIILRARLKYPLAGMPEDRPWTIYGLNSFLQEEFHVDWVIKDLLPMRSVLVWSGKPGVGKTQAAIQVGMSLALGRNFCEFETHRQWKILFVSQEMAYPPLHHILSKFVKGFNFSSSDLKMLDAHFFVAKVDRATFALDNPRGQQILEDLIREHRPDGVIIDSLGQVLPGDLNDDTGIRNSMNYLADLVERENIFGWVIHHNRKAQATNRKPNTLDDIYGSAYIGAVASTVVSMWAKSSGDRLKEIAVVKNRLGPAKTYYWNHRDDLLFEPTSATKIIELTAAAQKPKGLVIGEAFVDDDNDEA